MGAKQTIDSSMISAQKDAERWVRGDEEMKKRTRERQLVCVHVTLKKDTNHVVSVEVTHGGVTTEYRAGGWYSGGKIHRDEAPAVETRTPSS